MEHLFYFFIEKKHYLSCQPHLGVNIIVTEL